MFNYKTPNCSKKNFHAILHITHLKYFIAYTTKKNTFIQRTIIQLIVYMYLFAHIG